MLLLRGDGDAVHAEVRLRGVRAFADDRQHDAVGLGQHVSAVDPDMPGGQIVDDVDGGDGGDFRVFEHAVVDHFERAAGSFFAG
jgi:hypothetical protein